MLVDVSQSMPSVRPSHTNHAKHVGERSRLVSAKLNGVNPQDWLTDVLDRVGGSPDQQARRTAAVELSGAARTASLTAQGSLLASSAGRGGALSGRPGTGAASGGFL